MFGLKEVEKEKRLNRQAQRYDHKPRHALEPRNVYPDPRNFCQDPRHIYYDPRNICQDPRHNLLHRGARIEAPARQLVPLAGNPPTGALRKRRGEWRWVSPHRSDGFPLIPRDAPSSLFYKIQDDDPLDPEQRSLPPHDPDCIHHPGNHLGNHPELRLLPPPYTDGLELIPTATEFFNPPIGDRPARRASYYRPRPPQRALSGCGDTGSHDDHYWGVRPHRQQPDRHDRGTYPDINELLTWPVERAGAFHGGGGGGGIDHLHARPGHGHQLEYPGDDLYDGHHFHSEADDFDDDYDGQYSDTGKSIY